MFILTTLQGKKMCAGSFDRCDWELLGCLMGEVDAILWKIEDGVATRHSYNIDGVLGRLT